MASGMCEAKFNKDHTELWCRVTWKVTLDNRTGKELKELTEGQSKALAAYCEKHIPWSFMKSGVVGASIVITPCEVYEKKGFDRKYVRCYDADTGELYAEESDGIFDGCHEIRVTPASGCENGENSTNVDLQ